MPPIHVRTPLWESPTLRNILGTEVLLKMEAFQPVGSFKARGMGAACAAAYERGIRRVVCSSGGNAGYAVAYAGRKLGMEVTIVVPQTTSDRAKELIARENAQVIVFGTVWDEAHAYATRLAEETGSAYVHPFDDPAVWQGHSTIIDELLEDSVKPGMIVVSVGGGGLLCGLVEGLHRVGWADVPVLAVETEGAASFAGAVRAGELITLDAIRSIAVTLGAKRVTPRALELAHQHEIIPWLVTDRQALDACLRFADDHRVLVEPACGAALAAGYDNLPLLKGRKSPVVIIVCGGAGINRELLAKWDREVK
ncbi:MAG TPA: pyridoxal-phosphate dependent enzyme [Anaerolineales bacterium]|nr:pyridoxal-phosphate dependent enzyme [Anaerolineales bacterium]